MNPTYLPHHGVLHESSLTTKLRVVFDGSVRTTAGISLNDTLMIGARLQDNLIDIMLRFRLHAIAITADLKKMYRQILVHEADRDYQRILWRSSVGEPIREFRLNTVTYGLSCAPFLAVRCVRHLASNADDRLMQASQVLLNDLYVDDILTGVSSIDEATDLIKQLKELLNDGGFEPHKWRSNYKEILHELHSSERIEESLTVASDVNETHIKTLGLTWHPERDVFEFSVNSITRASKTKREVLSAISRLFDPLGLISPILIRAKLIMQGTWAANLKWDDLLTDKLHRAWIEYTDDLNDINTIQVPRRIIASASARRFYLQGFCDASMKAYGACVYLQTMDNHNKGRSILICSKSRVAPIKSKTTTLPRLELCGAVVLVRLLKHVCEALKIEVSGMYAWSDSMIVLAWIAGDPSRQKTFVANRVAEIQTIVASSNWYHVKSEHNPADLISRGTSLRELKESSLWWEGPKILSEFFENIKGLNRLLTCSQTETEFIESEQKKEIQVFLIVDSKQLILQL
ncbi:PREDICTED: uncharacterized protein LOC105560979 [Vollenhovia emeryi]|uniref:uncharacterized protein LOC105560979 n=1 Tax=Vollenhovia emeryi TaxID=411798 RepID=UPI0005F4DAE3|nr:PREDICTED: uncharacterized protein LOC105560979 [Vollenhovia emeryi]